MSTFLKYRLGVGMGDPDVQLVEQNTLKRRGVGPPEIAAAWRIDCLNTVLILFVAQHRARTRGPGMPG
jgi:hypothetical protein